MPRGESSSLNRAIHGILTAGEVLAAVKSAYRRRVDISEGVSLTGFVAAFNIGPNVGPFNNAHVILLEDYPTDLVFEVTATNYESFALFEYRESFRVDQDMLTLKDRFDVPYQLRYGHVYTLVAYLTLGGAAVPPANSHLTAFGYENKSAGAQVALR